MEKKEYVSGTFCTSIECERHKNLEGLKGKEYLEKKELLCIDCFAWKLFAWLGDKQYRIVKTESQMSALEMAARIKGIDPIHVKDLTEDEILCL